MMYGDNGDKKKKFGNTKKSRRKEIRGLKKKFRKGSREYIKEGDKKEGDKKERDKKEGDKDKKAPVAKK